MSGPIRRAWRWLRSPSSTVAAGTLVLLGVLATGVVFGGASTAISWSNTLEFCTSCHEMKAFVYEEYAKTPHFQNASGVRAICADCHVPKALVPKLWRKTLATFNEVPKHLMGTIDTEEKFEARRAVLAGHVWDEMKANDSLACRGCHSAEAMLLANQKPRARGQHEDAVESGETCIDCHKGIAHKLPATTAVHDAGDADGHDDDDDDDSDDFTL